VYTGSLFFAHTERLFAFIYYPGVEPTNNISERTIRTAVQKILDHRGISPTGLSWPLAHLGTAPAAALTGDAAKSRKMYQAFLELWKDADPDIPILIEAKAEYAKLR